MSEKTLQDLSFEVRLTKFEKDALRAIGTVVINGAIALNKITVKMKKDNSGLYVDVPAMKSKKKDDEGRDIWNDVYHPINKEASQALRAAVLAAYEKLGEKNPETKDSEKVPFA